MNSLIIILSLGLLSLANCQILGFGSCPDITPQQDFDPVKYFSGKFYEQKRFPHKFQSGSKCVDAKYSVKENGKVRVENSAFSVKNESRFSRVGEAFCDKDIPTACLVQFNPGTPLGKYNVLSSDPSKYGLVYSCSELPGLVNIQYAWVLTREKTVNSEDMKKYLDIFKENGFDIDFFIDTPQDCLDN